MRILLVQAYLGRLEPPVFPAGLNALGRFMKKSTEHEIEVLDMNLQERPYEALDQALSTQSPEMVGISLRNVDTTQFRDRFYYFLETPRTAEAIKAKCPGTCLVIGGPGFSIYAEEIMERVPQLDFGIVSEGEYVFRSLSSSLSRPEEVGGLLYRANGKIKKAGRGELFDLAEYPDDEPYIVDPKPYLRAPFNVGVESSRGCAQHCIYCVYPFLNGSRVRCRLPERIVDEVQMLIEQHGLKTFQFIDPVFNIPSSHCEAVCSEIIRRGLGDKVDWIAWFAERNLSKEQWELAVEAGCVEFAFSPDAFADHVLKRMGKVSRRRDIEKTFEMASRDPRARVSYNFFISPPGERLSDFFKLLKFFVSAKLKLRSRCRVFASYIRIEPHAEIHKTAVEEGMLSPNETTLPKTQSGLRRLFYMNKRTRLLGKVFGIIYGAKRAIRRMLGKKSGV